MFATMKVGKSRSRKRNKSEVGKRKTVRDLTRDNKRKHEGGMFSKNTHVLRNHTREKERHGGGENMRVSEWGVGVERYSER